MTAILKVFIGYSRYTAAGEVGVCEGTAAVYGDAIVKRTNINLDTRLVRQAAAVLGTGRVTDTVHAAMREVVAREHRRQLAQRDLFADMTHEDFDAMRASRTFHE